MTQNEFTYDLLKILTKHKITDDFRVSHRHLYYLENQYRALGIRDRYREEGEINPSWIQHLGKHSPTQITPADDPNISGCTCILGRITIPQVIGLPDDLGVYRISSACGTKKLYPITKDRFMELVPGSQRAKFNYYFRIGTFLYITNFIKEINVDLILENPLDGYIIKSENIPSGSLSVGTSYKVVSGNIFHNSIKYEKGNTFTAVNANYTGAGLVQLTIQKIMMTVNDIYPMDQTLGEYIKMKILTQDFAIELQMLGDTNSDSRDENFKK